MFELLLQYASLVVLGNLKVKSAPTVTCKHHLLRMPLNERSRYSESIGVFPAESKSTASERAKVDFAWCKTYVSIYCLLFWQQFKNNTRWRPREHHRCARQSLQILCCI